MSSQNASDTSHVIDFLIESSPDCPQSGTSTVIVSYQEESQQPTYNPYIQQPQQQEQQLNTNCSGFTNTIPNLSPIAQSSPQNQQYTCTRTPNENDPNSPIQPCEVITTTSNQSAEESHQQSHLPHQDHQIDALNNHNDVDYEDNSPTHQTHTSNLQPPFSTTSEIEQFKVSVLRQELGTLKKQIGLERTQLELEKGLLSIREQKLVLRERLLSPEYANSVQATFDSQANALKLRQVELDRQFLSLQQREQALSSREASFQLLLMNHGKSNLNPTSSSCTSSQSPLPPITANITTSTTSFTPSTATSKVNDEPPLYATESQYHGKDSTRVLDNLTTSLYPQQPIAKAEVLDTQLPSQHSRQNLNDTQYPNYNSNNKDAMSTKPTLTPNQFIGDVDIFDINERSYLKYSLEHDMPIVFIAPQTQNQLRQQYQQYQQQQQQQQQQPNHQPRPVGPSSQPMITNVHNNQPHPHSGLRSGQLQQQQYQQPGQMGIPPRMNQSGAVNAANNLSASCLVPEQPIKIPIWPRPVDFVFQNETIRACVSNFDLVKQKTAFLPQYTRIRGEATPWFYRQGLTGMFVSSLIDAETLVAGKGKIYLS